MNGFVRSLSLLFVSGLCGCCQVMPATHDGPPPPPITPAEQVRRLEAWSQELPAVRATTVLAGVRFEYRDDKGQRHTENAEGRLLLQRQSPGTGAPHDVLLLGSAYDQPVFEAGRNDTHWWFIIRLDTKRAWVGDATRPLDPATLSATNSDMSGILRADLVPQLLGLAPLPPLGTAGTSVNSPVPGRVAMMVQEKTNHLIIADGRQGYIAREIIVDRYTGHVQEVRIFDPNGIAVVRSVLEDYRPVSYAADAPQPAGAATESLKAGRGFPHKVTVTYPAQQMTFVLQFDKVTVLAKAPPTAFVTPSFEGLRVVNVP